MLLFRIWILFRGYVIIRVTGIYAEKFINICVHRQMFLWDIIRKNDCVVLKMTIDSYKRIRSIAKKTDCKVKLVSKKGFPFFAKKYEKRRSFIIGGVAFIIFFCILWSFIWDIEVVGNKNVSEKEIEEYLAENNLKIGGMKYCINTKEIENYLMIKFDKISWVNVELKGTRLVIQIAERVLKPQFVDLETPCDIVAAKSGVITSMLTKSGCEVMKVGDTVSAGDVLISGIITPKLEPEQFRMVHAMGKVKAKTWYEKNIKVECEKENRISTGKVRKEYSIEIFSKNFFNINLGKEKKEYDEINTIKKFQIGNNFVLPLKVRVRRLEEVKIQKEILAMDKAKEEAVSKARNIILREMPKDATIFSDDIVYFEDGGEIFANVIIEVQEEIGQEQLIE